MTTAKRKTSKWGALEPKETPLDSVLAARTTSFLTSRVVPRCIGLKPILEEEYVGLNRVVNGANVRGRCSNRAPTDDTATVEAMVDDEGVSAPFVSA